MVTGQRPAARSLATVLLTDIVGSTGLAAKMGDDTWRRLLDDHDAMVRSLLRAHQGREINTAGDGFIATFASPTKAIACASAIVAAANGLGVQIRAGLHTGEVERRGRDVGGIGVHIAARVMGLAGPDEILVSNTVHDLVAGSGIAFAPRGIHALRGVPGRRRLFAVGETEKVQRPRQAKPTPTKTQRLRVVIADDHPMWRETLRALLERGRSVEVVAEAASGAEALELALSVRPDVIVMDIDMPRLNGIDATRAITSADPDSKVLMLSSLKEPAEVLAAVRAGARGYLIKTAGPGEVLEAITRIASGEIVFPTELSAVVLAELRKPTSPPAVGEVGGLTERERGVLELMAAGLSNQAIAKALHLSAKTVEVHIGSIFTKLGLDATPDHHRRVQAAVVFLRHSGADLGVSP